jgi:branched-chain amino acid transport system ATP-binding protein
MGSEDVQRIAQLIKLAARDRTVLMVEHNMGVVADIADRISVLQRGSVLTTGSYEQISTHPAVIEAYLGRRGAH